MAEQTEPVRRKVALKILKPGMDTRQIVARFEAERQALAIMDHPNIAKVHDGGATPAGRPYFVMELVKGERITEFCDQNHLTPRERLELFIPVCQAVQHAHQKGIIHRDLKPSNVLVSRHDSTPTVKVIDFGVAKALGQELTDKTLFTGFAQMVGTPMYMSPEQAGQNGLDIDTRSDIYSLGVLLYELLTGTTPFDKERFRQAPYDEIRRIIRDEEPPKPSTRLSDSKDSLPSISAQRHTEPAKLTRLVRGELDWIVMKALEKDRNRRYESASGFAADVQRYLNDEPVQAGPPSRWYRFRKFARRNKRGLGVASALALAILVVVGSVAASIGWVAREREAIRIATAGRVDQALEEAEANYRRGKLPEALLVAQKAKALLESGGGSDELERRVANWLRDLRMLIKIDAIHLQKGLWREEFGDIAYGRPAKFGAGKWRSAAGVDIEDEFAKAFEEYGIPVDKLNADEAAKRIGQRIIAVELAAVLHDWAVWRRGSPPRDGRDWRHLLALARAVDRDAWGKTHSPHSPDSPRRGAWGVRGVFLSPSIPATGKYYGEQH
jgi:hypothetical protein